MLTLKYYVSNNGMFTVTNVKVLQRQTHKIVLIDFYEGVNS